MLLFAFAIFCSLFTSCADKNAQNEIERLSSQNAMLLNSLDSLQQKLDSIAAYGDSVKSSLKKLDMGI